MNTLFYELYALKMASIFMCWAFYKIDESFLIYIKFDKNN